MSIKMVKTLFVSIKWNIRIWIKNKFSQADLYYVVEQANWAVDEVAKDVLEYMDINTQIISSSKFLNKNALIHFGSLNAFLQDKNGYKRNKNGVIVTCFHIVDSDSRKNELKNLDSYVKKWHTSCTITRNKMISLGISEAKIEVIPISINGKNYAPCNPEEKKRRRADMLIDEKTIVLGYFQKDGNGWGEGNVPKLIKGPDIFCDVVEVLARKYKIHVILSGPARGYVKKRLNEAEVPFSHFVFEEAKQVADLYKVIDIYMVTSREEGGPRAILESMASGVPIISTKVGQAPDIIQDGVNGILVDIEDKNALINAFEKIINTESLRERLTQNGLKTAREYDSERIAKLYNEKLYCR